MTPTWVRGVDASYDYLDHDRATKLIELGVKVFGQCLWTGVETPRTAQSNLTVAQSRGLTTIGYISVNGTTPGRHHVSNGRAAVDTKTWRALALTPIDVELQGIANKTIREAVDYTAEIGKRRAIYTSKHAWVDLQGDPRDFTDCLLWNAFWDDDEDIDFGRHPYGGWHPDRLVGEQVSGGTVIAGKMVDRNVFDLSLLTQEDPMTTDVTTDLILRRLDCAHLFFKAASIAMKGDRLPDLLTRQLKYLLSGPTT